LAAFSQIAGFLAIIARSRIHFSLSSALILSQKDKGCSKKVKQAAFPFSQKEISFSFKAKQVFLSGVWTENLLQYSVLIFSDCYVQ